MLPMEQGSGLTFRTITSRQLNKAGQALYPHGIAHALTDMKKDGWHLIHVVTEAGMEPLYIFEKHADNSAD